MKLVVRFALVVMLAGVGLRAVVPIASANSSCTINGTVYTASVTGSGTIVSTTPGRVIVGSNGPDDITGAGGDVICGMGARTSFTEDQTGVV